MFLKELTIARTDPVYLVLRATTRATMLKRAIRFAWARIALWLVAIYTLNAVAGHIFGAMTFLQSLGIGFVIGILAIVVFGNPFTAIENISHWRRILKSIDEDPARWDDEGAQ